MKRISWLITGSTLSLVLLSLNRLTSLTQGYVLDNQFLRWVDFNAMLPVSLLYVLFFYLLFAEILSHKAQNQRTIIWLTLLLLFGTYIFGASSGVHEPMNYLDTRICNDGQTVNQLCTIINFNDEPFGHFLYYIAVIIISLVLLTAELISPQDKDASTSDKLAVTINGLLAGIGIFLNLAFKHSWLDTSYFIILSLIALYYTYRTRFRFNTRLLTYYYFLSFVLGTAGTIIYKLLTH